MIGFEQLPDGAALDRTEDVICRISGIAFRPGAVHAIAFAAAPSIVFCRPLGLKHPVVSLKPFDEAKGDDLSAGAKLDLLDTQRSAATANRDTFVTISMR